MTSLNSSPFVSNMAKGLELSAAFAVPRLTLMPPTLTLSPLRTGKCPEKSVLNRLEASLS